MSISIDRKLRGQMHTLKTVYSSWQKTFTLIDWLTEHGLTSPPTQYRLSGDGFTDKRPNQQYQSTEGWLIDWLSMVLRLRQHNIGYEHKEYTNNTKIQ